MKTETYNIKGLSCSACAVSSQRILSKVKGVETVRVNYATHTAFIEADEQLAIEEMNRRLEKAGYQLVKKDKAAEQQLKAEQEREFVQLKQQLLGAAIFAIPLFILAMFLAEQVPYDKYIQLALTAPILIWFGRRFFVTAGKLALAGQSNMDTLVALGTGTAFLFSVFNTFFPQVLESQGITAHVYYETAGLLITFILLGRYFEERAKKQSSKALESLLALQPDRVRILLDGEEKELPLEAVQQGDILILRPGEKVPLDGKIVKGSSELDESMISGESLPVHKQVDDQVFSGTINGTGSFRMEVEKIGEETLLSRIIQLVEAAQRSEAPVKQFVDRISTIFVPSVIALSLIAGLIWWWLGPAPQITHAVIATVTVLVIACPCALGLATPTAIMVGIGRGARKGILIKGATALQAAQEVDAIIFDKTGTLTKGQPQLTDEYWIESIDKQALSAILVAIESQSEHPLSKALVQQYSKSEEALKVDHFESITGRGVKARIGEEEYFVGNLSLMEENTIQIAKSLVAEATAFEKAAQTVLYFAENKEVVAVLALRDEPKASSQKAVQQLQQKGIEVWMLTGDNEATASHIAEQMNISNYKSGLLPEDKIAFVKQLQEESHKVAMVGDGINDAPALAQAELGIAMKSGTDVAMESADMVLLNNDLLQLVDGIQLSRNTMSILKQNLFWAFIYNILGIPIAAGVLYPFFEITLNPMIAGAAMAFSSVSVVLNSLRIRV